MRFDKETQARSPVDFRQLLFIQEASPVTVIHH
jgi:hypothetical protein